MKPTNLIDCFKCNTCGNITITQKVVCGRCSGTEVLSAQTEGKAEIIDSTVVNYPPENYKDIAPYTSILVKLPGGCRFFAMMEGVVPNIPIGSNVKLVAVDEERGGMFFKQV